MFAWDLPGGTQWPWTGCLPAPPSIWGPRAEGRGCCWGPGPIHGLGSPGTSDPLWKVSTLPPQQRGDPAGQPRPVSQPLTPVSSSLQCPRATRSSSRPWRRPGSPRTTTWSSLSAPTAASTSRCSAIRPRATAGASWWTPAAPSPARPPGKASRPPWARGPKARARLLLSVNARGGHRLPHPQHVHQVRLPARRGPKAPRPELTCFA